MKPVKALTPEELRALLEAAKADDHECYVAYLLAVAHGLRITEVINLRKKDFAETVNGMQLTVQRLKGSNETTQDVLPSTNPLLDELTVVRDWIKDLKPNDKLFDLGDRFSLGRKFERHARLARVPEGKRHFHVCKHTAGIMLRKSGSDVVVIKEALGHRSLQSSMQYMRLSVDEIEQGRQRALAMAAGA